jgi:molybdopterin synthase catalytic subunit
MALVRVQALDFDPGQALAALQDAAPVAGGIGSFIGVVRSDAARPIESLTLEHYPGMTEAALADIAAQAERRFALLGCSVIHRFGTLLPGERIVFVGAAAAHRAAALDATAFLIDWLKTRAPFWKKERLASGEELWVEALAADDAAADDWGK